MKKLVIAAAIVCAAAMSQAAMIDWTINKGATKGYDFTKKTSETAASAMTVWLINYAEVESVVAAINANKTLTTSDKGVLWQMDSSTAEAVSKDKISVTGAAGTPVEFAAVIIDTDGKDTMYKISKTESVALYDPLDPDYSSAKGTTTTAIKLNDTNATWTAAAVPEPTSGLLLLLGVAGLALRRRRA